MRLRSLIMGSLLALGYWGLTHLGFGWGISQGLKKGNPWPASQIQEEHEKINLLVTFQGNLPARGQLLIRLFGDSRSFEQRDPQDETCLNLALSDDILWQFRGLKAGYYAVEAIHDVNEDGLLNPGELVCFSGPDRLDVTRPTFNSCRTLIDRDQRIQLTW